MKIYKTFNPPIYKNASEYKKKATDYFNNELYPFIKANPRHNLKFSECARYQHYLGSHTLQKGWDIRQPEIDQLKVEIKKLKMKLKRSGYEG